MSHIECTGPGCPICKAMKELPHGYSWVFRLGDGSRGNVFDARETPVPVVRLHYHEEYPAFQPETQSFYLGLYLDSTPYAKTRPPWNGWTTLAGV